MDYKTVIADPVSDNSIECHHDVGLRYNPVVRPKLASLDDVLYCYIANYRPMSPLYEDDLKRDVIQRENFTVMVLADTRPSPVTFQDAVWSSKPSRTGLVTPSVDSRMSNTEKKHSSTSSTTKPSDDQLNKVFLNLSDKLPKFFTHMQDYTIYHKDVIFQNNISGVTLRGVAPYMRQMTLIRVLGHLRFAYVKFDMLKITKHPEDGTIRVRWCIRGISGLRAMINFWRFKLWHYRTVKEQEIKWYDGFSTFYVGGDGLVHRHVCDKMMPDEQKEKSRTVNVAAKLAVYAALIPRSSWDVLCTISSSVMRFSRRRMSMSDVC